MTRHYYAAWYDAIEQAWHIIHLATGQAHTRRPVSPQRLLRVLRQRDHLAELLFRWQHPVTGDASWLHATA